MNSINRKIERLKAEMEVILMEFFSRDLKKLDMVLHCDNMYKGYGADGVKGFIGFVNYHTDNMTNHDVIKSTLMHDLGCVIESYECRMDDKECYALPKSSGYVQYYNNNYRNEEGLTREQVKYINENK
tara:strand:- start:442 stop:825 length:384 start_codon:yes stop_codon:yes gene_type:complete